MRAPSSAAVAVVTRPGEKGQRLSAALRDRGMNALWWPAFDLMAPDDLEPLRAQLQRLGEFDLAVFVSAGAVRGLAALELFGQWPAATAIAAPGDSTLQLARSLLPGAAAARCIGPASLAPSPPAPLPQAGEGSSSSPQAGKGSSSPPQAGEGSSSSPQAAEWSSSSPQAGKWSSSSPLPLAGEGPGVREPAKEGSEPLWEALQAHGPLPRRVLIVRAESGREWLTERLRAAGSQVEYASVYRRVVHTPSAELRAALGACRGAGRVAVPVVTSSEAVGALDRQLEQTPEARAWLRESLALCSHPRIAQALRAAGYARVSQCEPTVSGVLDAIAQSGRNEAAPVLLEAGVR